MEIDFREIVVATIGRETRSDDIDRIFTFQSRTYKMQLRWQHFDKLLDLNRSSGFYLKNISLEGEELVVLCYSNSRITESLERSGRPERLFLMKSFFDGVDAKPKTNTNAKQLTMDEFYERLKQKHLDDDLVTGIPTEVQHPSLRPVLRPYQKKGISWMLSRELVPSTLPLRKPWIKLRSRFNQSQQLYFNEHTQLLISEGPELYQTPKGGLLADEMGLGKTVQVIGLMLMNPYRAATKRKASEIDDNGNSGNFINKNSISSTVKCVCGNVDRKKTVLTCSMCSTQQHEQCIFRRDVTADDQVNYICPFCWKSSGKIINAKTTIVVSPASIRSQWKDELQRHVADKSFKVLMYEGIKSGWVHPTELVKYDVILADFSTLAKELSRELYYADTVAAERKLSLRSSTIKYEYPPSPLTSVRWWRVVLDEAQMVENKESRPSQMVKQLPAVHRWATTGTPIEKDSLQCLYGLIFFLNLDPYTDEWQFYQMLREYQSGDHDHLIDVVSSVMWRTCKKDVEHEINIPKQSEVVHEVRMTDLQEYYYRQAYIQSSLEFKQNVHAYLLREGPYHYEQKMKNGKIVRDKVHTVDPTMKNIFLYKLKNSTSRTFMDPLTSLRQDCTIPSETHQLTDQPKVKKVLRPEQLHEHLVKESTLEGQSALRTVCSSINCLAAIQIAENKHQNANTQYNQLLQLAKDCDQFVNPKLLIHAYNGLLDIAALTGVKDENHDEHASKMAQLEWKYISKRYENVVEINQEHRDHAPEMEKAKKDLVDVKGHWWSNIINVRRNGEDDGRFMEIINTECFQSVPDNLTLLESVRTTHGISVIITEWSDKIQRFMKEINKRFSNLAFIVNNLRPSNEMSAAEKDEICKLAQAALNCHLNQLDGNRNANPTRQVCCDLCKLKTKLDEFECLLFDKSLVGGIVKGSNSPRFEEKLVKAILTYARRSKVEAETLEMGNYFFKHLEAIKKQFKIHVKLYVAVDSVVSAYDELKMCKARIQVVESPKDIREENARLRMTIVRSKVPQQMQIFTSQKQEAEIKFASIKARLKYLEHLKEPNKIQPCPICFEVPQERYYVTVCGHTICAPCLVKMVTNRSITCPICRTVQETKTICAVTCHDNSPLELINGSYSPKIDEMIRCILRLKSVEPDVKILIFSQWDQNLEAISVGLKANNIEFRTSVKSYSNFSKKVEAFKSTTSNVTCLLLNLTLGSKGLNLTEATHVFLVEPTLKADEEMQAIGRVHRIGQTKETFVHRFIVKRTIEETIYSNFIQQREKWARKEFTINDLEKLFDVNPYQDIDADDE